MTKIIALFFFVTSCSSFKIKEGPKEYLYSAKITAFIRSELVKRQGLDSFLIDIVTKNGVIYLAGHVRYLHQKLLAEEVAENYSQGKFKVISKISIN